MISERFYHNGCEIHHGWLSRKHCFDFLFNFDCFCSIVTEQLCTVALGRGRMQFFLYACQTLRGFEGVKRQCEHVASSFFCMCVRFYVVWIEAQNISHMFTISSDYVLHIVLFFFFSLPSSDALHLSFLPILQP